MAVALVTTDAQALAHDPDSDMPLLVAAMAEIGVRGVPVVWHDASVDWSQFELAVLRSTWDYPDRLAQFREWLHHVSTAVRVANCAPMLQWNLDKTYLTQLEAAGVATVPTRIVTQPEALAEALRQTDSPRVVIKPTTSAGSRATGLFDHDDPAAVELASQILTDGLSVMIQPEVPQISRDGEIAVMCFDGRPSHAVRKGPLLSVGGGLIGGHYQEVITPEVPSPQFERAAEQALAAVRSIGSSSGWNCGELTPLYSRVDLADYQGAPVVLEVELVEPSCFLTADENAALRFARAIADRI